MVGEASAPLRIRESHSFSLEKGIQTQLSMQIQKSVRTPDWGCLEVLRPQVKCLALVQTPYFANEETEARKE